MMMMMMMMMTTTTTTTSGSYLTDFMEQNPFSEAGSRSAASYVTKDSLPNSLGPILRQLNPVHIIAFYFFNIHFKLTLPSVLRSPKWSLPIRFSASIFVIVSNRSCANKCV